MSRTGPLTALAIKFFKLPEPAPEETYDSGLGTILPAANFRRWVVWIPPAVIGVILGLVILIVAFLDFMGEIPEDVPFLLYVVMAAVWTAFVAFIGTMSRLSYLMLEFTFDDLGLHIRKGTLSIQEITLSYRNIQNVSIIRGPVDLLLGLSKVAVDTAGGGDGGAAAAAQGGAGKMAAIAAHRGMMLGIDRFVAEDLRRDLEARMRQFHGSGLGDHSESRERRTPRRPAAIGPAAVSPGQLDLLRRIVENLRAANAVLAPRTDAPPPGTP